MPTDQIQLEKIAKLLRYYILTSTTAAGSGHPSSSLSAVELMTALCFGGFFDFDTDHLIFSKGHAAPLFYALYAVAGKVSEEELMTLRQFTSPLEGHSTMNFKYTEAATGSLGQGLSIGAGLALNAKLDQLDSRTYVLLGDSEMAEGSVWEALQLASYYKLNNLIGIIDVNRLGQRGETMYGHQVEQYEKRIKAFGWKTCLIDGHNPREVQGAIADARKTKNQPYMIIGQTIKGKGVSLMEDQEGWHGKPLPPADLELALQELGEVDKTIVGERKMSAAEILNPKSEILNKSQIPNSKLPNTIYKVGDKIATRKAYGQALVRIFAQYPNLIVLDAETSNSTFAEIFKNAYPERFIECFIAEQNMVGLAQGLARAGKIPFLSSFAAFLTRAFDQLRMGAYSQSNIKVCGSHAGVSIGPDGSSQMGLEDLAMFRAILGSVVLYPADAASCDKLVEAAAAHPGLVYLRTTRGETAVIYDQSEQFKIGGSKVLRSSDRDQVTVVSAGITLFEALAAYEELQPEGINIRVIDAYSIKPLDVATLEQASRETKAIITVEDHYAAGGLGEAVAAALSGSGCPVEIMAVKKMPHSGTPEELLAYEEIDRQAIISRIRQIIAK